MLRSLIVSLPVSFRDKYRAAWNSTKLELSIFTGRLVRLLRKPARPNNPDGSINIHLGCGSINLPGFINIDGIPAPHIHYVRPIDDLAPFKNNSVNLIYACHCLEHFSHRNSLRVLTEWHRALKQGGILRLSVPDFDLILQIYNDNAKDITSIIEPLMGGQDYKFNFHFSAFTHLSLTSLLIQAGFKEVRVWQPGSSELTTLDDWSNATIRFNDKEYSVSLNLEAVK